MTILTDLRFACRMLWKDRGFAAAAITALALGLGVNATVFTFVNAVLIRGLPYPEADRILHVDSRNKTNDRLGVSLLDLQDWRRGATAFEALGAWTGGTMNVAETGRLPERIAGCWISANTFGLLRQKPILGRDLAPEDERPGAPPVVLLGHSVWQNRYGADPHIIGRVIRVNELPSTIIGVMPEGMRFPSNTDLWQALTPGKDERRGRRPLQAFGRLAPGATRSQAEAELSTIAGALAAQYPDTNKEIGPILRTFNERFNGGEVRLMFLSLMGAVAFVLLIACANVANLLLARSVRRTREVAVRVALGASRWRIMRQLLVESVLLATLGGALGLALAAIGVRLFDRAAADIGKPHWIVFSMDWTVFGFLAAICLATGMLFGLVPAWQVSKTNVQAVLKEGGRGQAGGARARRFSSAMVVVQLALTLVLLTGAGIMVRGFFTLYGQDIGIETTTLLTMRLNLPDRKYPDELARRQFYERLASQVAALPGAVSVTFTSHAPLGGALRRTVEIAGRGREKDARPPAVSAVLVGDRYFATLGLTLRRGRDFGPRDGTPGAETVIVNERFVSRFYPGEDPVGRRIRLTARDGELGPWVTIIGVSPTVRQGGQQAIEPDSVAYLPYRLEPEGFSTIIARGRGDASLLATPLREAVQTVDQDLPVYRVRTLAAELAESRWIYRVFGTMFTLFALIALVLSSVGIYAVMAYSVTQRRQEIGIRMALGAGTRTVTLGVLRGGLMQLLIGMTLGLAGGYGVSHLLESLLVRVAPGDPITFGAIVALLATVTIAACLIPARRAARVDPLIALRSE